MPTPGQGLKKLLAIATWPARKRLSTSVRRRRALAGMRWLIPCMVRNAAISRADRVLICDLLPSRIEPDWFLRHYREMGIQHLLLINRSGSRELTSLLSSMPDCSVWEPADGCPDHGEVHHLYNALIHRFCIGKWTLCVDSDELFVFPYMETRSLADLTRQLEDSHRSALWAVRIETYGIQPRKGCEISGRETRFFDSTGYHQSRGPRGQVVVSGGQPAADDGNGMPGGPMADCLQRVPLVLPDFCFYYDDRNITVAREEMNHPHAWHPCPTGVLLGHGIDRRLLDGEPGHAKNHGLGGMFGDIVSRLPEAALECAPSVMYRCSADLIDAGLLSDHGAIRPCHRARRRLDVGETNHSPQPVPIVPASTNAVTVAFCLMIHDNPARAGKISRVLVDCGHKVFIHLDAKSSGGIRDAMVREILEWCPEAQFVPAYRCEWGGWGIVAATLGLVRSVLGSAPNCSHLQLLSGADLPIQSLESYARFLGRNRDLDFIESVDIGKERWVQRGPEIERFVYHHPFSPRRHPRLHESCMLLQQMAGVKRRMPLGIRPMLGSQWWTLRRSTCELLMGYLERNPEVIRYFSRTLIPDESFFQSLVPHLVGPESVVPRTLTLCRFNGYGRPFVFYDDHADALCREAFFFSRKISPSARGLEDLMLERAAGQEIPSWPDESAGVPSEWMLSESARAFEFRRPVMGRVDGDAGSAAFRPDSEQGCPDT